MPLNYLDFDYSEDADGNGTLDAMASVLPAQLPALQSEIAAVLALQVAHVKRGDLLGLGIADLVSRAAQALYYLGLALAALNVFRLIVRDLPMSWWTVVLLILTPALLNLLQLALPRARDYEADRVAAAQHSIELLEHAPRQLDLRLAADQAHLVAARTRVDSELALEDAQVPVAFAIERGRSGVVVEDQGAAGRGVAAQWWTSRCQCSGASRITPSARRAE